MEKNKTFKEIFTEFKEEHPYHILLFKNGEVYEAFEEDAEKCARILELPIVKLTPEIPKMVRILSHKLDTALPKLIRAGERVCIAEFPKEETFKERLDELKKVLGQAILTAKKVSEYHKEETERRRVEGQSKFKAACETDDLCEASASILEAIERLSMYASTLTGKNLFYDEDKEEFVSGI